MTLLNLWIQYEYTFKYYYYLFTKIYFMANVSTKISLSQFENLLFSVCDVLRAAWIDASDYKEVIIGMLFLKLTSDDFDQNLETAYNNYISQGKSESEAKILAEMESKDFPFYVPATANWTNLMHLKNDIWNELNNAIVAIEKENSAYTGGISRFISFTGKGWAIVKDVQYQDILSIFSSLRMRKTDFEQGGDTVGAAYEYLIKSFADSAGKKAGEFYTPRAITSLLVKITDIKEWEDVYDPTCGSGGILIEAKKYAEEKGLTNIFIHWQENNPITYGIALINMILHGVAEKDIVQWDTLVSPGHIVNGQIQQFDVIAANPPFAVKYSKASLSHKERFDVMVSEKAAEMMFLQHMVASLKTNGRIACVLPMWVLFRGQEKEYRDVLLDNDIIEAIVALPQNLFYGTGIPSCIVYINKTKSSKQKNKVLFVNAVNEYEEGKAMNNLRAEDVDKIASVIRNNIEIDNYSKNIDVSEIKEKGSSLNVASFISLKDEKMEQDVKWHLEALVKSDILLANENLTNLKFNTDEILENVWNNYFKFSDTIKDENSIFDKVMANSGIESNRKDILVKLDTFYKKAWKLISNTSNTGSKTNFVALKNSLIEEIKNDFNGNTTFTDYELSGIVSDFFEAVKYELLGIKNYGFATSALSDELIKKEAFSEDMAKIDAIKSELDELESTINEMKEEAENNDVKYKTSATTKKAKNDIMDRISFMNKEILEKVISWKNSCDQNEIANIVGVQWKNEIENIVKAKLDEKIVALVEFLSKIYTTYGVSAKKISSEKNEIDTKLLSFFKELGYDE